MYMYVLNNYKSNPVHLASLSLALCVQHCSSEVQFYVNGRIVMVADELSFLIATGAHSRVGGFDGLRRHGRLVERRTDFKVDCKVSGLAASWRVVRRLIISDASDDDATKFPSS